MRNCVLWVGNGFTISMEKWLQTCIWRPINLTQLFPPPKWVVSLPDRRPLWEEPNILQMRKAVEAIGFSEGEHGSFQRFCAQLSDIGGPVSGNPAKGSFSLSTWDVRLQLRVYLWHLIRNYEMEIDARIMSSPEAFNAWPWFSVALTLARRFRLSVVSYNYDTQVEKVFGDHGIAACNSPLSCTKYYKSRSSTSIPMLKPHGSVNFETLGIRHSNGVRSNFLNCRGIEVKLRDNPNKCPTAPYIVPPGHSRDHYFDYLTTTRETIALAIRECDVLILCGFSAEGADRAEIVEYLMHTKKKLIVFHAGIRSSERDDSKQGAGPIVRGRASKYMFFEPNELGDLHSELFRL